MFLNYIAKVQRILHLTSIFLCLVLSSGYKDILLTDSAHHVVNNRFAFLVHQGNGGGQSATLSVVFDADDEINTQRLDCTFQCRGIFTVVPAESALGVEVCRMAEAVD